MKMLITGFDQNKDGFGYIVKLYVASYYIVYGSGENFMFSKI